MYNFEKIYKFLSTEGINVYQIKAFSASNKAQPVIIKYNHGLGSIVIKKSHSGKETFLNKNVVIDFVYGNLTSNFVIISDKIDMVTWRCFSLIDENFETYDFICEDDYETFYFLCLLEILMNKELFEKIDLFIKGQIGIKSIISKLYWKRAVMKIKFFASKKY